MKNAIIIMILALLIVSCGSNREDDSYDKEFDENVEIHMEDVINNDDAEIYYDQTGEYPDGTYCAEVEYYNPSTGTRNTYSLDVDVEGGELTVIHWPHGGWLDETHFYPDDISTGECEFTSDRGYIYTVTLDDFGGCGYTDEYKLRQDVNNETAQTTCSECGGEKDPYDDYCDDCEQTKYHTCSNCGGYKFNAFDEYCDDCQKEVESEVNYDSEVSDDID